MNDALQKLLALIKANDGINDKARLARIVFDAFGLTKDRSVYYCADFAIRFSASASRNFGNTVLSLSNLRKYDDRPFIVCLVMPTENYCLLANTTLLNKISHSSQQLRENNIRGSFNGSDIARELEGIPNLAENIGRLFEIHAGIGFEGNLARLVEATNSISPTGVKFFVSESAGAAILAAPDRAVSFVESAECSVLKTGLDAQVSMFRTEILLAALIENVNVRGRVIEYLIAGEDEALRQELIVALKAGNKGLPRFRTDNTLGDYSRVFPAYDTETDVKTKGHDSQLKSKGVQSRQNARVLGTSPIDFHVLLCGYRSRENREHRPCVNVSRETLASHHYAQALVGSKLARRHAVRRYSYQ